MPANVLTFPVTTSQLDWYRVIAFVLGLLLGWLLTR